MVAEPGTSTQVVQLSRQSNRRTRREACGHTVWWLQVCNKERTARFGIGSSHGYDFFWIQCCIYSYRVYGEFKAYEAEIWQMHQWITVSPSSPVLPNAEYKSFTLSYVLTKSAYDKSICMTSVNSWCQTQHSYLCNIWCQFISDI
jgi:hypothetical protein